jgi:hypothetical protein
MPLLPAPDYHRLCTTDGVQWCFSRASVVHHYPAPLHHWPSYRRAAVVRSPIGRRAGQWWAEVVHASSAEQLRKTGRFNHRV